MAKPPELKKVQPINGWTFCSSCLHAVPSVQGCLNLPDRRGYSCG